MLYSTGCRCYCKDDPPIIQQSFSCTDDPYYYPANVAKYFHFLLTYPGQDPQPDEDPPIPGFPPLVQRINLTWKGCEFGRYAGPPCIPFTDRPYGSGCGWGGVKADFATANTDVNGTPIPRLDKVVIRIGEEGFLGVRGPTLFPAVVGMYHGFSDEIGRWEARDPPYTGSFVNWDGQSEIILQPDHFVIPVGSALDQEITLIPGG